MYLCPPRLIARAIGGIADEGGCNSGTERSRWMDSFRSRLNSRQRSASRWGAIEADPPKNKKGASFRTHPFDFCLVLSCLGLSTANRFNQRPAERRNIIRLPARNKLPIGDHLREAGFPREISIGERPAVDGRIAYALRLRSSREMILPSINPRGSYAPIRPLRVPAPLCAPCVPTLPPSPSSFRIVPRAAEQPASSPHISPL